MSEIGLVGNENFTQNLSQNRARTGRLERLHSHGSSRQSPYLLNTTYNLVQIYAFVSYYNYKFETTIQFDYLSVIPINN